MAAIDRISSLAEEIRKKKQDENYTFDPRLNTVKSLAEDIKSGTSQQSGREIQYATRYATNSLEKPSTTSKGLFSKGTLADGYSFKDLDITRGLAATAVDTAAQALKGIASFSEGIVDTARYGISGAAKLLGADNYAEQVKARAEEETFNQLYENFDNWISQYSWIGDFGKSVAQGAGYMASIAATGNVGGSIGGSIGGLKGAKIGTEAASMGSMFLSSFGSSMSEAYQEGATDAEATGYGMMSAIAEVGSEMLFGGMGKMSNALGFNKGLLSFDDWVASKLGSLFKNNKYIKTGIEWGVKAGFEGSEDVIAGFLQGIAKYITYQTADDGFSLQDIWDNEDLGTTFLASALLSGIFQAPGALSAIKSNTDYVLRDTLGKSEALQEYNIPESVVESVTTKSVEELSQLTDERDIQTYLTDINTTIALLENSIVNTDYNVQKLTKNDIETAYNQIAQLREKETILLNQLSEQGKIKTVRNEMDIIKTTKPNSLAQANAEANVEQLTKAIDKDSSIPTMENTVKIETVGTDLKAQAIAYIENLNKSLDEKSQIRVITELSQQQKAIEELGAAFGKQVVFVSNADFAGQNLPNDLPDVLFVNNKINSGLLSTNSKNNKMLYVMGHELFHSIKITYPNVYKEFVNYVANTVTNEQVATFMEMYDPNDSQGLLGKLQIKGEFDVETIKNNKTKYKKQYQALLNIAEEMTANEFGGMVTDTEYMTTMATNNKTLFDKVVDAIKKLFKSLTKPIYKTTLTQYQISNIRDNFINVINEVQTNFKTEIKTDVKANASAEKVNTSAETVETAPINNTDVGIHFGDLGKGRDTNYFAMSQTKRSSGHFGTGVYFVGTDNANMGNKTNRPTHSINFNDYYLFKPKNADEANQLYNLLKDINNNELNALDLESAEKLFHTSYENLYYAYKETQKMRNKYDKLEYTDLLTKDSLSTIFVKELGYNGIDVRGIKAFDNGFYGSVIYDLDNKKTAPISVDKSAGLQEKSPATDQKVEIAPIKEQKPVQQKVEKKTTTQATNRKSADYDPYGISDEEYKAYEQELDAKNKEKNRLIEKENQERKQLLEKRDKILKESTKELAKKPIEVEKPKEDIKVTQMSDEQRITLFEKNVDEQIKRYNKTLDYNIKEQMLKGLITRYDIYKSLGGTRRIDFLEEQSAKAKNDSQKEFKDLLNSKLGNNVKYLPNETRVKVRKGYSNTLPKTPYTEIYDYATQNKNITEYTVQTNKETLDKGYEIIRTEGEAAIENLFDVGRVPKAEDVAVGMAAIDYYRKTANIDMEIAVYEAIAGARATQSGQYIQALKLLQQMSPVARVRQIQKTLNRTATAMRESTNNKVKQWIKNDNNANNLKLTANEQQWITDMMNKADKVTDIETRNRYYKMIGEYVNSKIPSSFASKLRTWRDISLLFNVKTQSRNYLSNLAMLGVNLTSTKVGSVIDYGISKITNQRTLDLRLPKNIDTKNLSIEQRANLAEKKRLKSMESGLTEGFKNAISDYKAGVSRYSDTISDYSHESRVFNEDRPNTTTTNKILNWVGHNANEIARLTYASLDLGDRPFNQFYYNQELLNQMIINNTDTITDDMRKQARAVADKKTYQNESKLVKQAKELRDWLNKWISFGTTTNGEKFGLGDIIVGYMTTPMNIAVMTYEHSPVAVASVIKKGFALSNAIKTNVDVAKAQREFVDTTSKMMTGTMFYILGAVLSNMGVLTGAEPEDKEEAEMLKATGWQKYSIKFGDTYWSYDWVEPISNVVGMGANMTQQDNDNWMTNLRNIFDGLSSNIYEQTLLNSIGNLFTSVVYGDSLEEIVIEYVGDLATSLTPTAMKQLADTFDPNTKLIYNNSNGLGGALTTLLNRVLVRIPFAKSLVPNKKTTMGTDYKTYAGGDNFILNAFNALINPSTVTGDQLGDVGAEIIDVYNNTGDNTIMPYKAPTHQEYTVNGVHYNEQFTLDEQSKLQEMMGTIVRENLKLMMNSDLYYNASYTEKAEALRTLTSYAKYKAIEDSGFAEGYTVKSGNAVQIPKYIDEGLDIATAIMYDALITTIKPDYYEDGTAIPGSNKGKKAYAIMNLTVSDDYKNIMLKLMDTGSNNPETVDRLEKLSTEQQFIDYYSLSHHDYTIVNKISREDYDIATRYYNLNSGDFTKYAEALSNIKSDYDKNGNIIANSKKNKIMQYINSLPLSAIQKIYLFHMAGYSVKSYRNQLYSYVNSLDISASEKQRIWTDLGF